MTYICSTQNFKMTFKNIIIFIIFLFASTNIYSQKPASNNNPKSLSIVNIAVTDVTTCHGGNNGTITITAAGGQGTVYYSIDSGVNYQLSNFFDNLTAGVYAGIKVKDDLETVTALPVTINEPDDIQISNETSTDVTGCYGDTNGTISISASGGNGGLTYSVDGGTNYYANSGNFFTLGGGTYHVVIKDSHGCTKTGSELTINQPALLEITNEIKTNVSGCYGNTNGVIDIIADGGTNPKYYSINNGINFQTSYHFPNLPVGTYNLVVKDANNCTTNGSELTITQPSELSIDNVSKTDVNTCHGESTGTITVAASGGTGNLNYSIDGGSFYSISEDFTNLYAGSYTIAVRDANFCTKTGQTITISQPTKLKINSSTSTDVETCFGDATGSITIDADGGTPALSYSIDGGTTFQATGYFPNLPYGTYQVYVKDSHDCHVTGNFHYIQQPVKVIIDKVDSIRVSTCYGDANGSISVVAYGGSGDISYSADNGNTFQTNSTITGLAAGMYNVVVKDENDCDASYPEDVYIGQPEQVIISDVQTQEPQCNGEDNGQIVITASGGTGTLEYSANNGVNYYINNIVSGLTAGNYNVLVRDSHNCTASGGAYTLGEPDEIIISHITANDVTSCVGQSNGSIIIDASGGTGNLEYSINGGSDYQVSNSFIDLGAGNYQVVVRDENSCTLHLDTLITLDQPDNILISNISHTDIEGCKGDEIGTITINASGGTPPLTYTVNSGNDITNNTGDFENLPAGFYSINVFDSQGCSMSGTDVIITEPDTLIAEIVTADDVRCYGENNGVISISGTGGELPYTYSINDGASYSVSYDFTGLTAGVYYTFIKDAFNCVRAGDTITLTEPDTFLISSVNVTNIEQCYGQETGEININLEGGVPDYIYSINGGATLNTNSTFSNLPVNTYYIYVKDAHGCSISLDTTINLTQPEEIEVTDFSSKSISCAGANDGEISITAIGGTGTLQYSIDEGANYFTNGDFTNLTQGSYQVSVKDENDCIKIHTTAIIYEPDTLKIDTVTSQDETCIGANTGAMRIYYKGGTQPYEFSANGTDFVTNFIITGLSPGDYTPQIRDANGCEFIWGEQVTIGSPEPTGLFVASTQEGCSPLNVQFTKTTEGTTYRWEFGDGNVSYLNEPDYNFINQNIDDVTYTVTAYSISDAGCYDTVSLDILVHPKPYVKFSLSPDTAYFPNTTPNILNTSPSGYTNYFWDFGNGSTATTENPNAPNYDECGKYTVTMSANNNYCTDTVRHDFVVIPHQPIANFNVDNVAACIPVSINLTNQSLFTNSISWDFGDGITSDEEDPTHEYENTGEYKITMSTKGDCGTSAEKDTLISAWNKPTLDFSVEPDSIMPPDQAVHCYNNAIETGATYFWDFGDGKASTEKEPLHYYTTQGYYDIKLIATSEHGCIDSLIQSSVIYVFPYARIVFPDAFTPNNDGLNDVFMPAISESVAEYEFTVYNRQGEMLFYTNDISEGWNGKFKNVLSPQDVYVWRVVGKYRNSTPFDLAGSFTLLR